MYEASCSACVCVVGSNGSNKRRCPVRGYVDVVKGHDVDDVPASRRFLRLGLPFVAKAHPEPSGGRMLRSTRDIDIGAVDHGARVRERFRGCVVHFGQVRAQDTSQGRRAGESQEPGPVFVFQVAQG